VIEIQDKYQMSRFTLQFDDASVEERYVEQTLSMTHFLCRFAWVANIVIISVFTFLDSMYFPENQELVLLLRMAIIAASLVMFASTFLKQLRLLYKFSSAVFILLVGTFSSYMTGISGSEELSPYFFGLFIAFSGVFIQTGIGFSSSFWAMMIVQAFFAFICGVIYPVSGNLLLTYIAFLPLIWFIGSYDAYMIEKAGRGNFVITEQLRDSLAEVRALSGLLPICASCKSIRDDKGYWAKLESYISEHSDVQFSHGICPSCIAEQYPDIAEELNKESGA